MQDAYNKLRGIASVEQILYKGYECDGLSYPFYWVAQCIAIDAHANNHTINAWLNIFNFLIGESILCYIFNVF